MPEYKTALITGGNSGIGLATAKMFRQNGYEVWILGRSKESLERSAKTHGLHYIVADLSDPKNLASVPEKFANGLDVLVNNAGQANIIPLQDITLDAINSIFSVNVNALIYLTKLLTDSLARRKGAIINVSSIIVDNGKPGMSLYAATKGAVEALTRNLALELAPRHIRVNAVSPGAIETPVIEKLGFPPEQIEALKAQQAGAIPLQRFGIAEEVGQVILAQAESSYTTGSVWTVDGGVGAS